MPARSNLFQRVVYLAKRAVAENADVQESRLLRDLVTGAKREVDICIEATVAGHTVLVAIECRDSVRKATVQWVEQQNAKHQRLGTQLILVSRLGFSAEAEQVAATYGIETMNLQELESGALDPLLGDKGSVWLKIFQVRAVETTAELISPGGEHLTVHTQDGWDLFVDGGQIVGSVGVLVKNLLRDERTLRSLAQDLERNHGWFILESDDLHATDHRSLYLQEEGSLELHELARIRIRGQIRHDIREFQVTRGRLGSTELAFGVADTHGQEAMLLAAKPPGGAERLLVDGLSIKWAVQEPGED